jgi:hypothetical protein
MAGSADYPWLESTSTGVAPLSITNLRTIESVVDTTTTSRLSPLDRRNIMESDSSLSTAGSPVWYYLTTGNTVAVYPSNTTDTLSVRYWKVPTDLTSAADEPGFPARFHHLIVDGAAYYAYLDSDNFEAAASTHDFWLNGRKAMDEQLLVGQHDQPDDFIVITAGSVDG